MLRTALAASSALLFTAARGQNFNTTVTITVEPGVYNSSSVPAGLPWNVYNYCNAPHVNAAHYEKPTNVSGSKLVYLNAMIRHHKRTPDNLYPNENELNPAAGWDCTDFIQENYGGGTARVFHQVDIPSWHPFLSQIWNGTCDVGQLTAGGLADAVQHGKDFWSVYNKKLGFLRSVNTKDILMRTSTEDRTQQVAGGLLFGFDKSMAAKTFPLHTQPSNIDSIPPDYSCPNADNIRNAYQSVPAWTDHLEQMAPLKARLDATLGTANLSAWSSWYDHFFDTFTSRTCGGHPLPCNSTGACVSEADADLVHAIGDFEYNYIWNTAENATTYNQLTFGVMFQELAMNFRLFQAGGEAFKMRFYVAHDGSMVRLASGLGLGKLAPLRWPALGSEMVFEVWRTPAGDDFVRVFHEGTPVPTLNWVSLDSFIALLESNVPADIFAACNGS